MKNLLHKINLILQEEKVLKEEKLRRGEEFNIFEVMRAESYEVRTHSAFIAELLNPKGKHGQGDAFLKLFLDTIQESLKENSVPYAEMFNAFDVYTHTYVEYNIGPISANKEEGGRIDILLEGKGKAIIIENKIYAGDQEKQLYRYRKFAQQQYGEGNYLILYLTLDGHSPDEKSLMGTDKTLAENEDYFCISYEHHICDWLSLCKEKATAAPLVRETITQYHDLIKKLTYQDMETTTKEKLTTLLAKPENIGALFAVTEIYSDVLNKVCDEKLVPLIKDIEKELGCDIRIDNDGGWTAQYSKFSFQVPSWGNIYITFEFGQENLNNFYYGIWRADGKEGKQKIENILRQCLEAEYKCYNDSNWWAFGKYDDEYRNWNNDKVMKGLNDGSMKEHIEAIVKKLWSYFSGIENK